MGYFPCFDRAPSALMETTSFACALIVTRSPALNWPRLDAALPVAVNVCSPESVLSTSLSPCAETTSPEIRVAVCLCADAEAVLYALAVRTSWAPARPAAASVNANGNTIAFILRPSLGGQAPPEARRSNRCAASGKPDASRNTRSERVRRAPSPPQWGGKGAQSARPTHGKGGMSPMRLETNSSKNGVPEAPAFTARVPRRTLPTVLRLFWIVACVDTVVPSMVRAQEPSPEAAPVACRHSTRNQCGASEMPKNPLSDWVSSSRRQRCSTE